MRDYILQYLAGLENGYGVCGIIDRRGRIYPLGSDTKVLSTLFENIARQAVASYAARRGLTLYDAPKQNYYPDFTLAAGRDDRRKIAVDVKTTYYRSDAPNAAARFSFTLGSYTSFLRNGVKNIVFPYDEYAEHWIIGFVYRRVAVTAAAAHRVYTLSELAQVPAPFADVAVFVSEKWRIAGDRAGSGNTANIGSIAGTLSDFQQGSGVFQSESEFLAYWRGYGRTAAERAGRYHNSREFRVMYQC